MSPPNPNKYYKLKYIRKEFHEFRFLLTTQNTTYTNQLYFAPALKEESFLVNALIYCI